MVLAGEQRSSYRRLINGVLLLLLLLLRWREGKKSVRWKKRCSMSLMSMFIASLTVVPATMVYTCTGYYNKLAALLN